MTTPNFTNKDGSLTAYSLACGYRESCVRLGTAGGELETQLFRDGCYHVLTVDRTTHYRHWESFRLLSDARRAYCRHKKLKALTENYEN